MLNCKTYDMHFGNSFRLSVELDILEKLKQKKIKHKGRLFIFKSRRTENIIEEIMTFSILYDS